MQGVVVFQNVTHQFEQKEVLRNVTFAVREREIFGLLGASGAGKTTILRIITGQLQQTKGTSELLGESSERLTPQDYRQIGMMLEFMSG